MALEESDNTTESNQTVQSVIKDILTFEQFVLFEGSLSFVRLILSAFGIVGNGINIWTFLSMGVNDGFPLSMVFLAFIQLFHVMSQFSRSVAFGFFIAEYASGYQTWYYVEPYGLYLILGHVGRLPYTMAVLTTAFSSFARCMCVAKPLQFKWMFTPTKSFFVLCAVSVISAGSYVPVLSTMAMRWQFDPRINSSRPALWIAPEREQVKILTWIVRNAALPLLTQCTILFCVVHMGRKFLASTEFRQTHSSISTKSSAINSKNDSMIMSKNAERGNSTMACTQIKASMLGAKEVHAIQQMIIMCIVVIACDTPEILISFVSVFTPTFGLHKPMNNIYLSVIGVNHLFQTFNSTVNVVIYWSFSSRYRRHCPLGWKLFDCVSIRGRLGKFDRFTEADTINRVVPNAFISSL